MYGVSGALLDCHNRPAPRGARRGQGSARFPPEPYSSPPLQWLAYLRICKSVNVDICGYAARAGHATDCDLRVRRSRQYAYGRRWRRWCFSLFDHLVTLNNAYFGKCLRDISSIPVTPVVGGADALMDRLKRAARGRGRRGPAARATASALETPAERRARWRSVYVIYFTMFLMSLGFSVVLTGVWPYLDKDGVTCVARGARRDASRVVTPAALADSPERQALALFTPAQGGPGLKGVDCSRRRSLGTDRSSSVTVLASDTRFKLFLLSLRSLVAAIGSFVEKETICHLSRPVAARRRVGAHPPHRPSRPPEASTPLERTVTTGDSNGLRVWMGDGEHLSDDSLARLLHEYDIKKNSIKHFFLYPSKRYYSQESSHSWISGRPPAPARARPRRGPRHSSAMRLRDSVSS
ncbi:Major facilitator superfamily domain-containing protein 8 [Eumeta japonica]|uniref:Major facilitator superfamily domain-containing protein 8 n=1 Tax=Eumeta variegata TaxID=151549 RepID=A0A4C1Z0T6_EUMVA|nr:Major facilitator superfamily domain-containing protein 8 [Eumeta japonica]